MSSEYDLRMYTITPPAEEGSVTITYTMIPNAFTFGRRRISTRGRFLPPTARAEVFADAKGLFAEEEEVKASSTVTFTSSKVSALSDAKFAIGSLAEVSADGRVNFAISKFDSIASAKFAFASELEEKFASALFYFATKDDRFVDGEFHMLHISDVAFIRDFLAEYVPTLRTSKEWGASIHFLHSAESVKVLFPPQKMNKVLVFLRGYMFPVDIVNNTSETLVDFQVPVIIDSASLIRERKMRYDCADIRVLDTDKWTVLPFWVEKHTTNSSTTYIWVKVPEIPPNSTKRIYVTFGDLQAPSLSNGVATFDFFDDFDESLDTNVWYVNASDYIVSDSILRINVGAIGLQNPLPFNLNDGYIVESRVAYNSYTENTYSGVLEVSSSRFTAGSNAGADATILYMVNNPSGDKSVRIWIGTGTSARYDITSGAFVFSSEQDTWYVLGNETTPTTAAVWKDYTRMNNYDVSWEKDIKYLSLGFFSGSNTNIKDTSYDWVRVRKFRLDSPTAQVGGERLYPYIRTLPQDISSTIITNQTPFSTLVVALYFA